MHAALKDIPLPNSRELYRLVTDHNDKYSETVIAERAKDDAEQNIPAPQSSDPAPFEKQLLHEASILASKVSTKYKNALEMLDAKIKAELDFQERRKNHSEKDIANYAEYETASIEDTHQLRDAHKQLELAEERFNKLYEKFGRAPIIYVPHWLYIILAIAIFAGEIPLNALVFQIFGENQIMTWIMAVIIGLAVPLTAHFIGIKFREHAEGLNVANLLKGIVALAVIVAALYGLSLMRQTYLGEFRAELGLTDNLVESSFMFFWLNVAVLGAAIMVSYLAHDQSPGFQRSEQDLHRARRLVNWLERDRLKKLKSSRYKKLKLVQSADEQYRDGQNQIILLKGYYDMVLKEGQELENQCLQGLRHDIEIYRRENLRARPDKQRPDSFSSDLGFPLTLNVFKEKLVNEEDS